jgi:hypothetical protein
VKPDKAWLALLAPLPAGEGELQQELRKDPPLAGWLQARLVLGDGVSGMRILTALFDAEGRPGSISDMVATEGGQRQESMAARIEPDGRVRGTYWLTEGDRHMPRALAAAEEEGLRQLSAALHQRLQGR